MAKVLEMAEFLHDPFKYDREDDPTDRYETIAKPTYSCKGSPTSKHRVGGGGIATHHRKNSHLTTTHNPTIIQSVFDPLQKAHHARTVQ